MILKKKNKKKYVFCFDLDNTICKTVGNKYKLSKPDHAAINAINLLYDKGHIIKIFTARYMGRSNDNIKKANKKIYKFTYNQLKKWNLKFHKLFVTKPSSDIYIDDKAYGYKPNWKRNLIKF
tara:strand:- start:8 stop:373 length:366 start_codon:yes stop_codon:yes gene_type:complete